MLWLRIEPIRLHPTSIEYVYIVVEHYLFGWRGILRHTHTIATILSWECQQHVDDM